MEIKKTLHHLLRLAGFYKGVHAVTRRYPTIFVYHRFGPGKGDSKHLGGEQLDRQLQMIRKNCTPISLNRLYSCMLNDDPIPDRAVVITIDDGYEDFYRYALPVFKKYQMPATLFVVSDFINNKIWLWPDLIEYLMLNTKVGAGSVHMGDRIRRFDISTSKTRMQAWNELADYALSIPDRECRKFIGELAVTLKVQIPELPTNEYAAMSWDRVREARLSDIEIGSHTCTHPRLTRVDDTQLAEELERSKRQIETQIGDHVRAFCYPFGRKADISTKAKCAVTVAGYDYATIGYFNLAVTADAYELKRLGVNNQIIDFTKKLYGWEILKTFLTNRQFDR